MESWTAFLNWFFGHQWLGVTEHLPVLAVSMITLAVLIKFTFNHMHDMETKIDNLTALFIKHLEEHTKLPIVVKPVVKPVVKIDETLVSKKNQAH